MADSRAVQSVGCIPTDEMSGWLYAAQVDQTGTCQWSRYVAGAIGRAYQVDGDGNLVTVAHAFGAVDFGLGDLAPIGANDIVLAKINASGITLWANRFAADAFADNASLSVSTNGSIVVGAPFSGDIDLRSGPLTGGSSAAVIAKFSAAGVSLGQHLFTANNFLVAADPSGDALVLASGTKINFGNGEVLPSNSGVAMAKIDLP